MQKITTHKLVKYTLVNNVFEWKSKLCIYKPSGQDVSVCQSGYHERLNLHLLNNSANQVIVFTILNITQSRD